MEKNCTRTMTMLRSELLQGSGSNITVEQELVPRTSYGIPSTDIVVTTSVLADGIQLASIYQQVVSTDGKLFLLPLQKMQVPRNQPLYFRYQRSDGQNILLRVPENSLTNVGNIRPVSYSLRPHCLVTGASSILQNNNTHEIKPTETTVPITSSAERNTLSSQTVMTSSHRFHSKGSIPLAKLAEASQHNRPCHITDYNLCGSVYNLLKKNEECRRTSVPSAYMNVSDLSESTSSVVRDASLDTNPRTLNQYNKSTTDEIEEDTSLFKIESVFSLNDTKSILKKSNVSVDHGNTSDSTVSSIDKSTQHKSSIDCKNHSKVDRKVSSSCWVKLPFIDMKGSNSVHINASNDHIKCRTMPTRRSSKQRKMRVCCLPECACNKKNETIFTQQLSPTEPLTKNTILTPVSIDEEKQNELPLTEKSKEEKKDTGKMVDHLELIGMVKIKQEPTAFGYGDLNGTETNGIGIKRSYDLEKSADINTEKKCNGNTRIERITDEHNLSGSKKSKIVILKQRLQEKEAALEILKKEQNKSA